jgi:hypothetical protein
VANQGDCNQQLCITLNQSYIAAVQQAKSCCSMCDMISCTLKVKTELACPCDTYVEASNTAAIQTMKSAEAQWNALNCGLGWACPAMPCPWVSGANCVPTSSTPGGYCMDISSP